MINKGQKGNILFIANYPSDTTYAWWLMEQFWKTIAIRFGESGLQSFLAYPKINAISETILNAPIELVELTLPWENKGQEIQFKQFVENKNIKFIYFTDQSYFKMQYLKMHLYGIEYIINHDHTPGDRPAIYGLRGFLKSIRHKLPWVCVDKVFCVSDLMKERSILNQRIPEYKCRVVQNGIKPLKNQVPNVLELRKSLNLDENVITIITSGRAHPYKRFDFIIECALRLKNLSPDFEFVFLLAGDGPSMSELKDQVNKLGLEGNVKLLGFRKDIHDLLFISDIAVHAALGEAFSLSIIEYMSSGLPVLVPNIPSVSQAVSHDETGYVYTYDDPEDVAKYISGLGQNSGLRDEMGKSAKNTASELYTLSNCLNQLIEEIELACQLK